MRVLICGGGTGGHIYPALAAVTELRQEGLGVSDFLWIGAKGQMEEELVPRAGLRLAAIGAGAIVGVSMDRTVVNSMKLAWSVGTANRLLGSFRPDVLLMTGGYVTVPVGLAAWLRRLPSAIYLPDVEPGASIKALSRIASYVACSVEASRAYLPPDKVVVTGYPVRPEIRAALSLSQAQALARFDLEPGRPTMLVFGGSRGARSINRALLAVLETLLATTQVIHVSGTLDWPEVAAQTGHLPSDLRAFYRPYAYLHDDMGAAFRAADLVVARAGASMLGECPAFSLPAVLVPYPHAWRYQKVNADYLAARGAAVRLDDAALSERLLPTVLALLNDRPRLSAMAAAARALDVPDAAGRLAGLLQDLAQGR